MWTTSSCLINADNVETIWIYPGFSATRELRGNKNRCVKVTTKTKIRCPHIMRHEKERPLQSHNLLGSILANKIAKGISICTSSSLPSPSLPISFLKSFHSFLPISCIIIGRVVVVTFPHAYVSILKTKFICKKKHQPVNILWNFRD